MAAYPPVFRVICHLDMDAFYASVEQRDNPALRGRPVIVGAPPTQRGVVAAASYEARKFGVRSAMPSVTAGRLCPQGVFVRPRMDRYQEESGLMRQLMAETGAVIEPMSIDEAYLDLSAHCQAEDADASLRQCVPIARQLKERIRSERGLTATIGIAANKLLAKIASDFQKPDGLTVVSEREKVQFLRPLPVRVLYGVGRVTEQVVQRVGIRTVGDLQDYGGDLRALVGSFGPKLKQFALGEDDRPLELGEEVKSISGEETFLHDTDDRGVLRACLRAQAADIAATLKRRHQRDALGPALVSTLTECHHDIASPFSEPRSRQHRPHHWHASSSDRTSRPYLNPRRGHPAACPRHAWPVGHLGRSNALHAVLKERGWVPTMPPAAFTRTA